MKFLCHIAPEGSKWRVSELLVQSLPAEVEFVASEIGDCTMKGKSKEWSIKDPGRPNDRLLRGMKGSMSEFELGMLRTRMLDAARSKARPGELRISVPIGYVWHREFGLGLDPDLRVQEVIRLIFARFRELGSARQVLLSLAAGKICFPRPSDGKRLVTFDWTPIRYRNVISVLKNPFYAGAYAYGKSGKHTGIVEGRARKSYGHGKPLEEWEVLLKDHHEGYVDWAEFERNQAQLAANAHGRVGGAKAGRGGRALLVGVLSCARCGRRLTVSYRGRSPTQAMYRCERPNQLGITRHRLRHLIASGLLAAEQVVPGAPYQIRAAYLQDERVIAALGRKGRPCRLASEDQLSMFPDT